MVIIAVLGVIGIMLIMNLQLCSDTLYSAKYVSRLQNREASYYIARSAYNGVVKLLDMANSRDGGVDSLHSLWAQELPPLELDEGIVTIRIEDEDRYFNINSILGKESGSDEKHMKQFQRLLELLDINPYFANAVIDWMDNDKTISTPGGAETIKNSRIPCKNSPFDSLDELFYIDTFNENWFYGVVKADEKRPGLRDVLTTFSSGKVNINTASIEVLQSLDESISRPVAQEIINLRAGKAFKDMNKLLDVPGMNSDILYRINYLADVKSSYFRIRMEIKRADDRTDLVAVIKRESRSASIVFWKVE